jgi:hypothetical protein
VRPCFLATSTTTGRVASVGVPGARAESSQLAALVGQLQRLGGPLESLEPGDRSQKAEHHERLVEGRVYVVRPVPSTVDGRVGPQHVVVGEDVAEAEPSRPRT